MMNRIRRLSLLLMVFSIAVAAQDSSNDVVITLERTPCFGTCPVYTISIFEDGTVTYEGERNVTVTGSQTSEIPPETVAAMVAAFVEAGYFDWDEAYDTQTVSDLPTVITSVMFDGTLHRIARYAGDSAAPLALRFLEQWIDVMTNSFMWTGIRPDVADISSGMDTPLLTLQRGDSFGVSPVYNIAAYEDGTVVHMGIAHVDALGVQVSQVDPDVVAGIAQVAHVSGYFEWQDSYHERLLTDQATIISSIRWEEQVKRISRYAGDPNAPIGLVWIEASITRLVTAGDV